MISEQEAREALRVYKEGTTPTVRGFASLVAIEWAEQELARRDWQDEPSEEGWYWCEELDADAPPQKIERNGDGKFRRWTVAGWLDLNGRVCKITERAA